ncbi:MAG: hypothetical protein IJL39_01715 [Clostridia bacterium]|nr:hypothetical protein [Clostridia bacterium]
MRIEIHETGSEAFYKETVNVLAQYRSLIKKPERKLQDYFKKLWAYAGISLFLLALLAVMYWYWGASVSTVAAMGLMVVNLVLCGAYLINLNRLLKEFMGDARISVLTLDESGVELSKDGTQVVRIPWDGIAFLRVFKESVCFLSRNLTGFVISVNLLHRDEILGYLKENDIGIRIIEA